MENNNARIVSNNTLTEGRNEIIIDIGAMGQDKLEKEIDKMLDEVEPPPSSERCIYMVPREIRKVNEEAYTPRIVSIGPFHHNNKNLESMEQVKKRYMKKLVQRRGKTCLKNFIDAVKKMEARIRDCYSERIEMDSDKFVLMILVDSCFIIQFLISYHNDWKDNDDRSLSLEVTMKTDILLDFILLENQVPFFVLEKLFTLAISKSSDISSFLELAVEFLLNDTFNFFEETKKEDKSVDKFPCVKHFTHLALILCQPPPQKQSPSVEEDFEPLFSSTNLAEVGVTFREKTQSKGFFDINFTNKVLEIPNFSLHDDTEIKIRNLMALEHCRYPEQKFVTDYFVFMDFLINTTRDVELLVDSNIITNYLGTNKTAADFFNNLCINVINDTNDSYFLQVYKKLNDYYKSPKNRLKAILKRNYFEAAITLFVLTFIQTVCSIISTIRS
ncbi:hypothetical protein LguiA_033034 [Lonicera macranthoides]